MRRPAAQEKTLERIRAWRAICPDLTIRSTFIVGFPGETEDDFRFLLDWLDEAKLDRVGAFQYEPVKGATANDLGLEPVSDEVKASRLKRFMARAQAISMKKLAAKVGRRLEVIVDEGGARRRRAAPKATRRRSTAPCTSRRAGRCAPATLSRSELIAPTLTIYGGRRRDGPRPRAQGQKDRLEPPRTDHRAPRGGSGWPAQSAAPHGVHNSRHGCRHGGARRDDRHRGAADHGASVRSRAGERDLDRQRLSARGHGFASAAGGARRHGGLSTRLLVGTCPFHRRLARLRARADICPAHLRARRSGPGRGGNHERQHRAYPVHLSARAAWPRGRQSWRWWWRFARPEARALQRRSFRSPPGIGCF